MEVCAIGDLHGHSEWKAINPDEYDKIIFLGDYVDSFDISTDNILLNLTEVIEFARKYSDKVILLIGNHKFVF